jgi:hypothetical protein
MDQNETVDLPEQAADGMTTEPGESIATKGTVKIVPTFLAELARAMQSAAKREREHIVEAVATNAAEQIEKARVRAASEADELRRLADADIERIAEWTATEMDRIRREADRRTEERRNDLTAYLANHESIIETEIGGVDAAVRDYRSALDQFFGGLTGSTEPAEIARRAGALPEPPDLDSVRAAARADAVARFAAGPQDSTEESVSDEPESGTDVSAGDGTGNGMGVGVMDPDSVGRSEDLPDPTVEVEAEARALVGVLSADSLHVPADDADQVAEVAVAKAADHANPAVRLLRSIAPWASAHEHEIEDRRKQIS